MNLGKYQMKKTTSYFQAGMVIFRYRVWKARVLSMAWNWQNIWMTDLSMSVI